MKPYHWTMFGLLLDIVGAFLVSVEAIRLDNLRALRTKLLEPLHTATLSPKFIYLGDRMVSSVSRRFMFLYNALHYLVGVVVLVLLNYVLQGRLLGWAFSFVQWLLKKPWYVILVLALIVLAYGIVGGLWMLGELVHMGITQLTRLPIPILSFIDARTPDGTIGIIGFAFLLLGFLLQMWSAYLTATRT
jgi:hypothetical protein